VIEPPAPCWNVSILCIFCCRCLPVRHSILVLKVFVVCSLTGLQLCPMSNGDIRSCYPQCTIQVEDTNTNGCCLVPKGNCSWLWSILSQYHTALGMMPHSLM
jgi:hypothetical protein